MERIKIKKVLIDFTEYKDSYFIFLTLNIVSW